MKELGCIQMIKSLKEDVWKILIWFIGFFIIFLLDMPITFLNTFIIILLGYIIGDILDMFIRRICTHMTDFY